MFFSRLLPAVILVTSVFAQTFNGNLTGIATDPSGAALPGATFKLDSPSTGLTRITTSSANGNYLLADLPVGIYTLTVSAPGRSRPTPATSS